MKTIKIVVVIGKIFKELSISVCFKYANFCNILQFETCNH